VIAQGLRQIPYEQSGQVRPTAQRIHRLKS
jgi:hypothetical protein